MKFGPGEGVPRKFEKDPETEMLTWALEEQKEFDQGKIAEVEEKSGIDHLTGVVNRGKFDHELEQVLKMVRGEIKEKRVGHEAPKEISLVAIDLDHFKKVNDTHGHAGGDEVLRSVSALLKESVRETDVVGRVGGEEFMLILRGANVEGAMHHAEELRARIKKLMFDAYPGLKVTASFGIASSQDSADPKTLYKHADDALYKAKKAGRNLVAIHKM